MPKFGELLGTDVWAAAARTLTDFSAEEIFDLPIIDSFSSASKVTVTSSGTANAYGSWVQILADVGAGKRLIFVGLRTDVATSKGVELEIGQGAGGSEVAITRVPTVAASWLAQAPVYLWLALADNIRLSCRIRDDSASADAFELAVGMA